MDRHVPLHCFRKHCAGAGIHAEEILEKMARYGAVNPNQILEHVKIVKSIPTVLEETVLKYDAGSLDFAEYITALLQLLDETRKLRQEALAWIPLIRTLSDGDALAVWQKDYIQEINEYAGELWQMEKHLMEYIADIYVKDRSKLPEKDIQEIGVKIAKMLSNR